MCHDAIEVQVFRILQIEFEIEELENILKRKIIKARRNKLFERKTNI